MNKYFSEVCEAKLKEAKFATNKDLNTVKQRTIENKEQIRNFWFKFFIGQSYYGFIIQR